MDLNDAKRELKQLERETVVLLVAKELNKLALETAMATIESMGTKKYVAPDCKLWARRIISIVKEHSV
jgi:hypothetical protein